MPIFPVIFEANKTFSKQPNTVEEKNIDETRQGEYLMLDAEVNTEKKSRKLLLESYGCQMNFSDSEIVASILAEQGMAPTKVL